MAEAVVDYIDIFYFADDLGGQSTLLMSRETYRDVIQPYHAQLIARSKQLLPSSKAMFHTDGAVFDIIPDLLDAGVEILEAVQTDAAGMEPVRLKQAFGDRLCFHGGIPVQSLLPNEDTATVRLRCKELVRVFGNGGGYVAAPTHAIQHGTPPENVMAMLETVLGPADFAAALEAARG
ncbi:MAG: uroporphyrinogen decarboxylase family protein [Spirochaetota bacterium]